MKNLMMLLILGFCVVNVNYLVTKNQNVKKGITRLVLNK